MYQKFIFNIKIFLVSIIFTTYYVGLENISPYSIDWLFSNPDSALFYLGWCNFLNDIWRFPFGSNPNYGGLSSSIVYADLVPIFALIFKLLRSFFSENFNYFSIWIFFCFYFQIFFSYKIVLHYTNSKKYSFIASIYFALAPIFLQRMGYVFSHGGQFLILGALYLINLKFNKFKFNIYLIIILISILVHFYIFIMISIIFFIDIIKKFFDDKKIISLIKIFFVYLFLSILIMYISGYFNMNSLNSMANGYGFYKFNLLGFFDPVQLSDNKETSILGFSTWSLFLKDLPSYSGEYEGFSYLGLGIILLFIISSYYYFVSFLNTRIFLKSKIHIIIFFVFTIISLSTNIDFGHLKILHIDLNKYFYSLLGIVRASGRFIWPAYYLIFIFVFVQIFFHNNKSNSIKIILICLIIQLIDTSPGLNQFFNGKYFKKNSSLLLKDNFWQTLKLEKKILTTYETNYNELNLTVGRFACENKIVTNIFYLGRYDRFITSENRYEIYDKIFSRNIEAIPYIISNSYNHILDFKHRYKDQNLGFFYADNLWIVQKNKGDLMRNSDFSNLDDIKFPKIKLNNKINSNDKLFFGIGWMNDVENKNFIWSDGNISSFLFKLTKQNFKNNLIFNIDENSINKDSIKYNVLINDKLFDTIYLKKGISKNFVINLDRINLDPTKNEIDLRIDFVFENLLNEFEKLTNINGNKRAFMLKNIELN